MNNNFDLFASSESDNLQEDLATHSYSWTNKLTWVLVGLLIFVSGGSAGIWYSDKKATNELSSNQGAQGKNQNNGGKNNNKSNEESGSEVSAKNQQGNRGQGGGGGRGTVGVIKKITGKVIEMETSDGRMLTVTANDQTRILSTTSDSFASLRIGDAVSVQGEISTDGSIAPNVISKGDGVLSRSSGSANPNSTGAGSTSSGKSVKAPKSDSGAKNGKGNKNNKNKKPNQNGAATNSQTSGDGSGQGNRGGGGALRNPEFRACLTENGVEIPQGERPDMNNPKVAAAVEKCRALLPQGGQGGQGGGQGGQSN